MGAKMWTCVHLNIIWSLTNSSYLFVMKRSEEKERKVNQWQRKGRRWMSFCFHLLIWDESGDCYSTPSLPLPFPRLSSLPSSIDFLICFCFHAPFPICSTVLYSCPERNRRVKSKVTGLSRPVYDREMKWVKRAIREEVWYTDSNRVINTLLNTKGSHRTKISGKLTSGANYELIENNRRDNYECSEAVKEVTGFRKGWREQSWNGK